MCRPPPDPPASRRILELTLPAQQGGLRVFLQHWRAWRRQSPRPRQLHYVLVLPTPPDVGAAEKSLGTTASDRLLRVLLRQLVRQLGLARGIWAPGFHRLELDRGQVLLTVCIGPLKAVLRAQHFLADALWVSAVDGEPGGGEWDRWTAKALARLCQPGCTTCLMPAAHPVQELMGAAGFTIPSGAALAAWPGQFLPRWVVKSQRQASASTERQPGTCLVIGAGLAGAAIAAALARRGWHVQVLAADGLASASGIEGALNLPVGLFCPQVSKNDAPLSRLVRAGIALLTQRLPKLLVQGRDWALTGAMETLFEPAGTTAGRANRTGERWHAQAGWVKPQALLRALLATPGIHINQPALVQALRFQQSEWQALDAKGALLAHAQVVVLATAGGTAGLLPALHLPEHPNRGRLGSVHPVHGQISWGFHALRDSAVLPRHPVNGHGHLSAHVPEQRRRVWYVGATYETGSASSGVTAVVAAVIAAGHARNFQRLQTLAPALASHLEKRFDSGDLHHWRGTRFATRDRLPVVGPWLNSPQPGLWLNAGLGSRGLSWCLLNAELLAAQLHGEPLPVDAWLAGKLAP